MNRVLLTGSNGFIGSAVLEHLQEAFEVIQVLRSSRRVSGATGVIEATLGEAEFCEKILKKIECCDAIVHIAAAISFDNFDEAIVKTNCLGSMQMARLARKLGCRVFIYLSSVQVIGAPSILPLTENHPEKPLTVYHASKLFAEHALKAALGETIRVIVLRIPSPVGWGMPPDKILPTFIRQWLKNKDLMIAGNGKRVQNYLDVRDVALAVGVALKNLRAQGVYNIVSPKSYSNLELAKLCISLCKSCSNVTFSHKKDLEENNQWFFADDKQRSELKFLPKFSLEDTILQIKNRYENSYF